MLKQLTLTLLFISSLSSAQIPAQKIEDLKAQAKQEAQEKHLAEKEKALDDLEKSGIGISITSYLFIFGIITCSGSLKEWSDDNLGENILNSIRSFIMAAETSTLIYSSYKAHQGLKHLYYPDHPKPEETPEKEEKHA